MEPTPSPLQPYHHPHHEPAGAATTPPARDRYWLHILLALLAFLTTSLAGTEHITNRSWFQPNPEGAPPLQWADIVLGLPYACAFMAFLLTHEFGHYFTARFHRVKASLPYAIPFFFPNLIPGLPLGLFNIGSMGAVIRVRQTPPSRRIFFDIGVAGPLAGFVISLLLLTWGFTHLPPREYLYQMNPRYQTDFGHVPTEQELLDTYGRDSTGQPNTAFLTVGNNALFWAFEHWVADPERVPGHLELIHYPWLFAGFLTLFFTAMNLLPIGQLDGGHVIYGLFGAKRAWWISRLTVLVLLFYGGLGMVDVSNIYALISSGVYAAFLFWILTRVLQTYRLLPILLTGGSIIVLQLLLGWLLGPQEPYPLWLFYSFLAVRVIGLPHPVTADERPLTTRQKVLGWLAVLIFLLSFTPRPLDFISAEPIDPQSTFTHR